MEAVGMGMKMGVGKGMKMKMGSHYDRREEEGEGRFYELMGKRKKKKRTWFCFGLIMGE